MKELKRLLDIASHANNRCINTITNAAETVGKISDAPTTVLPKIAPKRITIMLSKADLIPNERLPEILMSKSVTRKITTALEQV